MYSRVCSLCTHALAHAMTPRVLSLRMCSNLMCSLCSFLRCSFLMHSPPDALSRNILWLSVGSSTLGCSLQWCSLLTCAQAGLALTPHVLTFDVITVLVLLVMLVLHIVAPHELFHTGMLSLHAFWHLPSTRLSYARYRCAHSSGILNLYSLSLRMCPNQICPLLMYLLRSLRA